MLKNYDCQILKKFQKHQSICMKRKENPCYLQVPNNSVLYTILDLDVSENSGTPPIIHVNRVFHYKPSILGYPYFWKHPSRIHYQISTLYGCQIFTAIGPMTVTPSDRLARVSGSIDQPTSVDKATGFLRFFFETTMVTRCFFWRNIIRVGL